MPEQKTDIDKLKKQRDALERKAFFMLLEIAFIFAVPAVASFFLGKYLDNRLDAGSVISTALLIVSFLLSWTIVIVRFRKLKKGFSDITERIKEEEGKGAIDTGGNKSAPENK